MVLMENEETKATEPKNMIVVPDGMLDRVILPDGYVIIALEDLQRLVASEKV